MFNDELIVGLKEIIETKDLDEIMEFMSMLSKSYRILGENQLTDEYEIEDAQKYLELIEEYFQSKEKFDFGEVQDKGINPYEVFKPCYDILQNYEEFYDILAERIEELESCDVSTLNFLMNFCIIQNPLLYRDNENFEANMEYKSQISYNLKDVLCDKISELNIEDFIKLDYKAMDSFYDEIIDEKVAQMNEEEFYKYMLEWGYQEGYRTERIEEKFQELNSPALYNLYASLNAENYNEKGNKMEYLKELRNRAIKNIEKNITDGEVVSGYGDPPQPLFIPKWSEEDYKRLEQSEEYKLFIEKISKLNNQEFVMYLISNIASINDIKIDNENKLIEKKIKELSDTDLEAVDYILVEQYFTPCPAVTDEIQNRDLLVEKVEIVEDEELKSYELKNKDLVKKRAKKYTEIMNFDFSERVTKPITRFCSDKAILTFQNIENNLIRTICNMEKYSDMQCMQMINQLNQTENINDYECVDFEYNEYDWDKDDYIYKDMPEEEKIHIYKQKCKYQLIKYLSKRLLSMPKGYLAMANISNKDGAFNEVIEMGLENTQIHIAPEKDDENCL